jgi:hypothetical protein
MENQQFTEAMSLAALALQELRNHLLARTFVLRAKDRNGRGAQDNTRRAHQLRLYDQKIWLDVSYYNHARDLMAELVPPLGIMHWEAEFRPLLSSDIVGIDSARRTKIQRAQGHGDLDSDGAISWLWADHLP